MRSSAPTAGTSTGRVWNLTCETVLVLLLTYSDFLQRVRRHRPSELLPALATTAVQFFERDAWATDEVRLPWAIAAAAKASVVAGNEFRSSGVSEKVVFEIRAAYNALDSPLTNRADDVSGSVGALSDGLDALETEVLDSALIERLLDSTLTWPALAG